HAGQEHCLGCGLVLRNEKPRRWTGLGDRMLVALVLLVLGAAGALAAVAVGRSGGTHTIVATPGPPVAAPPPTPRLPVLPATTVTALPPTLPTPRTTTQSPSTLTAWTLSDGYTVVLVSLPHANGRSRAEEEARLALAKGLTDVGVLDSNDFSGLASGYFVVFSGVFQTGAEADDHLAAADAAGFHSAYERHITR